MGANVANLTLVLSMPVLVFGGVVIQRGVKRQAALSATGVTVFGIFSYFGEPSILKGVVLALLMLVALRFVIRLGDGVDSGVTSSGKQGRSPWIWTLIGLVGTVGFANLVVHAAPRGYLGGHGCS